MTCRRTAVQLSVSGLHEKAKASDIERAGLAVAEKFVCVIGEIKDEVELVQDEEMDKLAKDLVDLHVELLDLLEHMKAGKKKADVSQKIGRVKHLGRQVYIVQQACA